MTVAPRYQGYAGLEHTGHCVPLELPASAEQQQPQHAQQALAADGGLAAGGDEEQAKRVAGPSEEAAGAWAQAALHACRQGGVERVFVEHPVLEAADIYGGGGGGGGGGGAGSLTYYEAGGVPSLDLRYSVLCQAALAAPVLLWQREQRRRRGRRRGEDSGGDGCSGSGGPGQVVFVANDWPAALAVLRLQQCMRAAAAGLADGAPEAGGGASLSAWQRELAQALGTSAAVFCIHNLAYQGVFGADVWPRLRLSPPALPLLCTSSDWREALRRQETQGLAVESAQQQQQQQQRQQQEEEERQAEQQLGGGGGGAAAGGGGGDSGCAGGQLNFMRGALLAGDALVTVSPSYAEEIQGEAFGCGLQEILAARGVA